MSGVCCRNFVTRNNFVHHRRPDFSTLYLSRKHIHSNSERVTPVKLAYASYETMKENKDNPKQPIIIMHGLFGSKNNWITLSKAIHQQTDRKVITIDARNHGDSPHSTDMSYNHMVEDLVRLMSDLGLKKSVLVGHSMGGATVMYTALRYPELVEKLIVVDMSPMTTGSNKAEIVRIIHAMRAVNLDGSPTLTKARKTAEEQLIRAVKPLPVRQFLTMNIVEADMGKYKWRLNLPVMEQKFPKELCTFPRVQSEVYTGPTLFVGGSNSDYIKVGDHKNIKQLFPSAEFTYVNGAGHWVHSDKPTEFLKNVIGFINRPHA